MKKAVTTPRTGAVTADFFEVVRQMCAKSDFAKKQIV